MGQLYEFRCQTCGYEATVSGDDDVGEVAWTTTIACRDCQTLSDVVVQLKPTRIGEHEKTFVPVCPKSATHIIELWKHPGKCPKCGNEMSRPDSPDVFWD